jgi:hypothetical protein
VWYIFLILVSTSTPPTIFTQYAAVPLPWSFSSAAACESARAWTLTQLALTPPAPNTKQIPVCVGL